MHEKKRFFDLTPSRDDGDSRRRRGTLVALPGHTQLPLQAGPTVGSTLHLPRQTRMGAVLLQGGAAGAGRAHAQESAGLHRHEPDRPESGGADISGERRRESEERVTAGDISPRRAVSRAPDIERNEIFEISRRISIIALFFSN